MIKILVLALLFSLIGCGSTLSQAPSGLIEVRGNKLIAENEIIAKIKAGASTKEDVASLIGNPPSIINDRECTTWSYVYSEIYPFPPIHVEQVSLVLHFDNVGILKPKPDGIMRYKHVVIGEKSLTTRLN